MGCIFLRIYQKTTLTHSLIFLYFFFVGCLFALSLYARSFSPLPRLSSPSLELVLLLVSMLQLASNKARIVDAPGCQVLSIEDVEAILDPSAFMRQDAVRWRCTQAPCWSLPEQHCGDQNLETVVSSPPKNGLATLTVDISVGLHRNSLIKCLSKSTNFAKEMLTLSGCLRLADTGITTEFFEVHHVASKDAWRFKQCLGMSGEEGPGWLCLLGIEFDVPKICAALESCVTVAALTKDRTVDSLTATEKKQILESHKNDPLPPGYFFNGHQYMSFDGSRSTVHPCLDEYLQQWVDEQNIQNKQIQAALGGTTNAPVTVRSHLPLGFELYSEVTPPINMESTANLNKTSTSNNKIPVKSNTPPVETKPLPSKASPQPPAPLSPTPPSIKPPSSRPTSGSRRTGRRKLPTPPVGQRSTKS
eukprot:m.203919 g.203919  ORF g.203919 m.203919 type:complete len:418 (+) comp26012_c0_seq12:103-1356(+)